MACGKRPNATRPCVELLATKEESCCSSGQSGKQYLENCIWCNYPETLGCRPVAVLEMLDEQAGGW